MNNFDHSPSGITSQGVPRQIGFDVTRAVALIGVVMMNYHGYLNDQDRDQHWWDRLFDVYTGLLSTRFAAAFVLVAGAGVALMSRRALTDRHEAGIIRWRLVRRGLLLMFGGFFLNMAWPGTIIFYYGAYFLASSLFFTWKNRSLIVLATMSSVIAVVVACWEALRQDAGYSTQWMHPTEIHTPQDFLIRTFIAYTHPVFPWLTFFCLGILVGRNSNWLQQHRRSIIGFCLMVLAFTYGLTTVLDIADLRRQPIIHIVTSMRPSLGLSYIVSTAAIAILALLIISRIAEANNENRIIIHLQRSGQMTLTLYLLHVLIFYIFVRWFEVISTRGLATALIFAVGYWLLAITSASWWQHRFGRGPAERLYRIIGG